MSLQQLQAEIDQKADAEISKIVEGANLEAQKIIADAQLKAESLRDERKRTVMRDFETEGRAQLAVTRMHWKGELLKLKREWAGRVLDEAEKRIAEISEKGGAEYRQLLGRLILEGVAKLKGNQFNVETNSRDLKLIEKDLTTILEKAAKIKGNEVRIQTNSPSKPGLGGVIVSMQDGNQYFNNTLEARLSTVTQNLAGEVQKILFGVSD